MSLTTVFQISIYSLTALSGVMLAYGEEASFPSGLTPFLCVLAFFFNERYRLVRLNLLLSNVLGLVALGVTCFEFFGERADARLVAGAHFLVYLIWIVLLQDKQPQQYWWLFALGLLQVAVGTVMTLSGWYGLLMLAYLLLALWTMAVFHLYQSSVAFEPKNSAVPKTSAAPKTSAGPKTRAAPRTSAGRISPADGGSAQHAAGLGLLRDTTVEDAIQQDIPNRWITSRFVFGVAALSMSGLTLGMLMFLLVPRVWLGRGNIFANQVQSVSRAMTGVSSEVRLGHLGKILESVEQVMEVRLYDNDSDVEKRVSLEEFTRRQGLAEPLFRGNVFEVYEAGVWSTRVARNELTEMRQNPWGPGSIRQEYKLQPQGSNVLFALRPISAGRMNPKGRLEINPHTRVPSPRSEMRDRFEYFIYSQPSVVTAEDRAKSVGGPLTRQFDDLRFLKGDKESYLELPPGRLDALAELTYAWIARDKLIGNELMSEARRRALTIESKLRDSGEYSYTLNMEIIDPKRDPVEDFLFNRKSGHCEYFASALALMLRAAGVPARLVTGYKGADPMNGSEYYEVQQRHAHAWVEAYFDDAWIVLDATPAARDESVRNVGSNSEFWKSATTSLSALWSTYVISMSQNRQKETLYDPFAETFSAYREVLEALKEWTLWAKDQLASPTQLLSGTGVSLLAGLLGGLALVVILTHRAWRWLRVRQQNTRHATLFSRWFGWLTRRWRSVPASRMIVEFYERFLSLVGASGLRPQDHQTQREFATQVEQSLSEPLRSAGLATLPREVTDLYYRVRFGGAELPSTEIVELDEQMRRLGEILRPRTGLRQAAEMHCD